MKHNHSSRNEPTLDPDIAFLGMCSEQGIAAFKRLIRRMSESGCKKLLLTTHPDYDFALGIAGSDGNTASLGSHVQMIDQFGQRYGQFMQRHSKEGGDCMSQVTRWAWIRNCWLAAKGMESGHTVLLFENGIGDMMNLNTGIETENDMELYMSIGR